MQSAAKLRRESNAAYQISPTPILDANEYAKKRSAAEAEPINIYIYIYIFMNIYVCPGVQGSRLQMCVKIQYLNSEPEYVQFGT